MISLVELCDYTLPADVKRDEYDPDSHDDEQRLEGNMVLDRLQSQTLHEAHLVVLLKKFQY